MKKFVALSFVLVMVLTMHISSTQATDSVPDKVMQAKDSVVRIMTEYTSTISSGSGFVIQSDNKTTLIATNYHVVEGNPLNISVLLDEDETITAHIIAYSDQKDLCVLELAYPRQLKSLVLNENEVSQGDPVYAIGFPSAADNFSETIAKSSDEATITDGIVSATRKVTTTIYGSPVNILQINADINPGNSGGPLFNKAGEVVGINTYGILDSQGINGAIEIGELITLLSDNNISFKTTAEWTPVPIIISTAVLLVVVTIVILTVRKKKSLTEIIKKIQNKQNRAMTLRFFMDKYPNGLQINEAISLLMPVAVQIKNSHESGKLHIQISPDKIKIKDGKAYLLEPSDSESDMYISGFAAPEVYRHKGISASSDVYSFCAILYFAASGKIPPNALDSAEDEAIPLSNKLLDEDFISIIRKGLARNSGDRFAIMQDLINNLLPFTTLLNVSPYASISAGFQDNLILSADIEKASEEKPNNGLKYNLDIKHTPLLKRKIIVTVSCILGFVIALCGIYLIGYKAAFNNAEKGEFETAKKYLFIPFITEFHDPNLVTYVNTGILLGQRQFDLAERGFASLSGYLNSEQLVKESKYRHAAQLADANNFDEAIMIYEQLSKEKYKDSGNLILDSRYRKGVYFLYEMRDYSSAEGIFNALKKYGYEKADEMCLETYYLWGIDLADEEDYLGAYEKLVNCKDYEDTKAILKSLESTLYDIGVNYYKDENYQKAKTYLRKITSYANSEDYLFLIDKHLDNSHSQQDISTLTSLIGFEDAGSLIFKTHSGRYFFSGVFGCSSGYIKLYKNSKSDWWGEWTLPNIPSGTWYFSGGKFYVNSKAIFEIYATSANTIVVYMISSSRTYTLTRR